MNSVRGTHWSVTLNMKNVSRKRCEEFIEQAKQANWGVQGQIEVGKEGTEHYQLLVKTPQVRLTAVKKIFATGHIEKARNVAALESYVHKEEGRIEEMKTIERKFVQFPEVRKKFFQWILEEEQQHTGCYERKLSLWDQFIGLSIEERIECDVIGVNPQYRSIIQRYWNNYVRVAQEDRQIYVDRLDRQTVTIPVLDENITNGERNSGEENDTQESEYGGEESTQDEESSDGDSQASD
jgi:hypothetical protein